MSKKATDEVYLKYHDYSTVKVKADRNKNYVYTYVNADKILDYANVDKSLRSKFDEAYKELFRHLHNSDLKYSSMKEGCMYISYLLHKQITNEKYYEYDFDTYKNFYDFANKYYEYDKSRGATCLDNMLYIDSEMFKKIDALYRLYDSYTDFLSKSRNWEDSYCLSLKILVHEYNNYMSNHKSTSIYLNGILEHFEKNLKGAIEKHKTECTNYDYNYDLTPIKPFIENKVEQPITKIPKSQPEEKNHRDPLNNNGEAQLKGSTVTHITQEVRRREETGETKQPADTEQAVVIEQGTEIQRVHSGSNNHEKLRAHEPYEQFRHSKLMHAVEPSERSTLVGESTFIPQNGLEKDQGFMASVRNTITGVLGEVDPVPVVGVSGGMGALFLLFRYTPVGAFFRGGRGRVRRIPSGFHGPFPGEFPIFQDYEGGYIGYGPMNMNPLAE